MSQNHKRLNQRLWKIARRAALERDNFRCVECVAQGRGGAGRLEVHHITPLYKDGMPFALDNLKTLCRECHLEISVFGPRLEWRRYVQDHFKGINQ